MSYRVLFVCLGNICRSPTAHGIFRQRLLDGEMQNLIEVDSAGTGDWHIGRPPDPRATDAAIERGIDISDLRARQVKAEDFESFDMILAMDHQNLADLRRECPEQFRGHLGLFCDFSDEAIDEVPDPYYGGPEGFDQVIDLIENVSDNLIAALDEQLRGAK